MRNFTKCSKKIFDFAFTLSSAVQVNLVKYLCFFLQNAKNILKEVTDLTPSFYKFFLLSLVIL